MTKIITGLTSREGDAGILFAGEMVGIRRDSGEFVSPSIERRKRGGLLGNGQVRQA